ncbi:MAG TPA: formate hydrogenlyase, partial [Crenotrichaceae bacterium]|nr:formate hydrogenlyase [Crenotrichaceae bacterium]
MNWLIAFLQTALFIILAPLLSGWVKYCKCYLQNRKAPSLLQPYRDLLKLIRKQPIVAKPASWLFIVTPYIVFSATALAASVIP